MRSAIFYEMAGAARLSINRPSRADVVRRCRWAEPVLRALRTVAAMTRQVREYGWCVVATPDNLALVQWCLLLAAAGVVAIRRCQAPECGRLFVREYRRVFCSRTCQRRVNGRRRRTRGATREGHAHATA